MMLSTAERAFVSSGVRLGLRQDGRSRLERRPVEIQTTLLQNAHGSARVRLEGAAGTTDILAIVTAELESIDDPPERTVTNSGASSCNRSSSSTPLIDINVDFGAVSGENRGDADSQLASFLRDTLLSTGGFDRRQLYVRDGGRNQLKATTTSNERKKDKASVGKYSVKNIVEEERDNTYADDDTGEEDEGRATHMGRAWFRWVLRLDVNIHDAMAGNVRDTAVTASYAALQDTVLPLVRVIGASSTHAGALGPYGSRVEAAHLNEGTDADASYADVADRLLQGFGSQRPDFELDDDPANCVRLDVKSVPLSMTFAHIFSASTPTVTKTKDGHQMVSILATAQQTVTQKDRESTTDHTSSSEANDVDGTDQIRRLMTTVSGRHEGWFVVDPTAAEESCGASIVTVAVSKYVLFF